MKRRTTVFAWLCALWLPLAAAQSGDPVHQGCAAQDVQVQVLGSGSAELRMRRAATSYLIWLDGRPRVLVDIGGGAALRFGQSGANIADLDVILLTHLHADHTVDLPALVDASRHEKRDRPLPIYGPVGNKYMPSTVTFVRELFDSTRGIYRYLGDFLSPLAKNTYKLVPQNVRNRLPHVGARWKSTGNIIRVQDDRRITASAAYVEHGAVLALAWRVDIGDKSIGFSGDTNGSDDKLKELTRGVQLLIAHHAVPEDATGEEHRRYMPPSVIGRVAAAAGARHLVLTHRTVRTLGREEESLGAIRRFYQGEVTFANDLDCFTP